MMPSQTSTSASNRGSLLDPQVLQKIGRMELVAKQVMDGFVQGLHRSPHVGFALDFAQHRRIGREMTSSGSTGASMPRASAITSSNMRSRRTCGQISCSMPSASMAYRGKSDPLTKFRYAQFVAACLSYLVLHQQDSAGLATFDTKIRNFIPPRSTPAQLMRLLRTLDETEPAGESSIAPILHEVAERITRRGMIIILSDFFDDAGG